MEFNNMLRAVGRLPVGVVWGDTSWNNREHRFFVWRRCGRHPLYRTKAALAGNPASLDCPQCDPRGIGVYKRCGITRTVGDAEVRLWGMLERRPGLVWSLQDGCVKNWKGRIDACVYFPLHRWLCIQVDGMTHNKKMISTRKHQPAVDERFNNMALSQGFSVLRLHEDHTAESWEAALATALQACSAEGAEPRSFVSVG